MQTDKSSWGWIITSFSFSFRDSVCFIYSVKCPDSHPAQYRSIGLRLLLWPIKAVCTAEPFMWFAGENMKSLCGVMETIELLHQCDVGDVNQWTDSPKKRSSFHPVSHKEMVFNSCVRFACVCIHSFSTCKCMCLGATFFCSWLWLIGESSLERMWFEERSGNSCNITLL